MRNILCLLALVGAFELTAQTKDSLPARVYSLNALKNMSDAGGLRKNIMNGSTTSLAGFEVQAYTLLAGKKQQNRLMNEQDELIIVKNGDLKITHNELAKQLGKGGISFTMAGDTRAIENTGATSATYYRFIYHSKLPSNIERAKQNGGSFFINWNDVPVEKTDKGHRRAFFNKPTAQLVKLEMHTTALNAGLDSHAPHTHIEEEIILLLKGDVKMFINGKLYKAAPGDVVFLPSGVLHALENTGKEQCEYFAFQWRN
ncbi:MAG: cupin domain-containing protein [Ferruginibacter sp.]